MLVRYVGWGCLPQVFDVNAHEFRKEQIELSELLTDEEHRSARATTLNAHYTPPVVIRGMYAALGRFGFDYGRVLEPTLGLGHFVGLMPEEMHSRSIITGIEIDSITARLAKALYPDADVRHQPFEEARLADGFYDLAISNVPFGDYQPFDPRFNSWHFPIHDYFFAAALEKLRPDGLLMFITSKGTLDKHDATLREYLSRRTAFLGAIRLPNDAFKANANTEVTTDIIMLRKLRPGERPDDLAWRNTVEITNSAGESISINEYFAANPEMMLGEMRLTGSMYRQAEPTLESDGRDLATALADAVGRLPEAVYQRQAIEAPEPDPLETFPVPEHIKPNAYCLVEGEVAIRDGDALKLLSDLPGTTRQRVRGLIQVRDAARECLRTQVDGSDEEKVAAARERLNHAYDHYVSRFGPISTRPNTAAFRGDPDLPLLLSLEHFDEETKRAIKAAIFRERTIQYSKPVDVVGSAKEALLVTLNERGRVDLDHMAALLDRAPENFLPELKGAIFLNPQTRQWETDDEYLSGNVRAKLVDAEAAALVNTQFAENVEALKTVQPEDLSASEIDVRLGASWVPATDVQKFAQEILGESDITVSHAPVIGTWIVNGGWTAKNSVANLTEWGTDRSPALDLLQDALNLKVPTVYDRTDDDKFVVNGPATETARDKQQKIKGRFKDWIWENDERRERLVRQYNDEFNSVRLRTFSGEHLTLPGASPAITLHPHQKAAVWRILQTPNTLLAHVVGAGKTYTMVAAGMELKRLGLARKPMFVVPNHMLGQFSSELLTLYPGANILVASKEDFESAKRRELMSRIATGNWDSVIVTHSGFERIPLAAETKKEFFREELHELELAILQQKRDEGSRRIVKDLERAKKRLETRLKTLIAEAKKDNTLTFEEIGVDRLFVDEAHYFKNLFYISKMTRIAGLPQTASERAFDMFLKVRHVQRVNGGGGVVFATGTPIANSVAEMFTMQRYLQMDALRRQNIHHFDSWAGTFGEPVTAMELSPDGAGYRINTRFARFINVPELMQQFRQVADIQTAEMLKLPVPEIANGKPMVVSAACTAELKELVNNLAARAEALKTNRIDPREDNMLKITTEGRKAALDLRLLDAGARDHHDSKVNLAVERIYQIWQETRVDRLTQLIFCDLSIPRDGGGFSVYDDMRAKLVTRGVPDAEIAFIQDYDSDEAKLGLFKDVRAGKVRILLGSTQKMGTGTNVQQRLVALHHLDAPWRPADVEQREGRILRQGNRNAAVHIFRYVTEGSFDAYMWQTLETKAKFINQVMTGEANLRRIEDVDGAALTYAEVKAIASGNPLIIEKATIDAEIARLTRLSSQHRQTQFGLRSTLRRLHEDIPSYERHLDAVQRDIAARQDTRGDAFAIEIDGQRLSDRGVAGELIRRQADRIRRVGGECRIGRFAGFEVFVASSLMDQAHVVVKGVGTYFAKVGDTALGTIRSLEHTVQGLDETASTIGQNIKDAQKRVHDIEPRIGASFEYAERLEQLAGRQQEIIEALDLTKNQASNRLATTPGEEGDLSVTAKEAIVEDHQARRPLRIRV
ncbi:MAG: DEAD/DEAH box helicase family protein [Verrucomicrobia bacterium]|nr:DEAD/DEAH box helicase family protein [Verrucomicrobiota bacterium]